MTESFWVLTSALSGFALGCLVFLVYLRVFRERRKKNIKKEVNFIINQAKSQALRIERNSQSKMRDMERKIKNRVEAEARKEKKQAEDIKYHTEKKKIRMEKEFKRKTEELEHQIAETKREKERSEAIREQMERAESKAQDKIEKLDVMIEKSAGLTKDQALEEIRKNMEEEVKREVVPRLMSMEEELKKEADKKARLVLSQAMARFSAEVSTERTTSSLPIKGEETKGKIIGREGRNIRALEAACGVDIIIEESDETILISCFDSVRREVSMQAIQRLLEEGRVHPARIEEVVNKTKRDMFISMAEEGKKVCFELGIHDIHPALFEKLGSLKYRFLSGNNVLKSSIEVAHLATFIAGELNFDEKIAKRAGLLHAIGLGVDHRVEGGYAQAGAEYARKNGESPLVCQAILCHTGDPAPETVVDHIVRAAHNLFQERPGARREVIESHINRMKDMESIANSFDGVIRSFALHAGKEVHVMVDSGKVTDEQAFMLSRDIAKKIQKELNPSGQLTVSVIRESRMVEQAR